MIFLVFKIMLLFTRPPPSCDILRVQNMPYLSKGFFYLKVWFHGISSWYWDVFTPKLIQSVQFCFISAETWLINTSTLNDG